MKKKQSPEGYLVFARKFRPENFKEIVGQDETTKILRNAIQQGRIPQAFLFAGPRGTGKTSTARILAKALNCVKGPTQSPCNECEICQEISRSISLDVLEVDGASNRRIDEVRDLRENVKFKPAQSRFKIYIIDEVHMLTDEAFNALLKTLEEPPPHVKFIFATTEPHKVPLTILSRCQRFNFKRIPLEALTEKLKEIAKAEGLKVEPNALFLIARISDGSLRDAETLLDQLSVLSQGRIREEEVLLALGLAGEEVYLELLEGLRKKEAKKILSLIQSLYESGKDLVQFGRGLHELFRDLLLLNLGQGAEAFIETGPEFKKKLASFKEVFSREELLLILSLLQNLQGDLRRALAPPKLLLETALLKLLHLEGLQSVKELVESTGDGSEGDRSTAQSSESVPARTVPLNLNLGDVQRIWPQVLEGVKAREMSTGMFLAEAEPVEVTDRTIILGFPKEFQFHKEMLERSEKRRFVEEVFTQFLGSAPSLQFVTTEVLKTEVSSQPDSAKTQAKLPEIVTKAMDIFQGSKVVRAE